MPNYRRVRIQGGTCFFTVNLMERRCCRLLEERIDDLRAAFRDAQRDDDNADRWARIKSGFSRRIPHEERQSGSRAAKRERGIWQRRFWEHAIMDEEDFHNHIDYIHINPVKHGYVHRAADWPHSSLHRYVRSGRLPPDWACDPSRLDMRRI